VHRNAYSLEFGSYYLKDEHGNVLYMCDQVAFVYDQKLGCLLKHGSPEDMMKWWREGKKKAAGLFEDIRVMALPRGFDVEEINRCLTTTGYVGLLARRLGGEGD